MEKGKNLTNTLDQISTLNPIELRKQEEQSGTLIVGCEFSPKEQEKITKLAKSIDIKDRAGLIDYGSGAQNKLTEFANKRLSKYNTSDLAEAGDALVNLLVILKTYNPRLEKDLESSNILVRLLKRKKQDVAEDLAAAKATFASVGKNLDEAEKILKDKHYTPLVNRIKDFDEMYTLIESIYHELSMYIAAGQERLDYAKTVELSELDRKAMETESKFDAQKFRDFADAINSFEGNLYCLETSRQLCIYNASYIRQLQNHHIDTANQIRQFIHQATPQWRIQMELSLCAQDIDSAQNALKAARDFTSQLFLATAKQLETISVKAAQNANKPIIPIETSMQVNEIFINTLSETLEAQKQNMSEVREGRKINHEIEEKRNQALREYAIKSAEIAVENAYINDQQEDLNTFSDETTANTNQPKKYTLD